jgi:hypothetical protein
MGLKRKENLHGLKRISIGRKSKRNMLKRGTSIITELRSKDTAHAAELKFMALII